MQIVWTTFNIIALSISLPALVLLFFVYKKLNEPLFKYTFFIRILPTISIFVILVLMLLYTSSNNTDEYALILGTFIHLSTAAGLILEVYFLHKMIQKPISLIAKIGLTVVFLGMNVEFFTRFNPDPTIIFNFSTSLLLGQFFVVYFIIQIYRALKKVTIPALYRFLKIYLIISIITSVLGLSYVVVQNFAPQFLFIYTFLEITSLFNISLSACIIIFIGNFFFMPVQKTETRITPEAVELFSLTPREIEVSELLLAGKTAKEIGESIYVSTQTAKNYTSKIYQKLKVKNKIEFMNLIKEKSLF